MYLWAGGSLGMPFGRDLCHTETGQLSCNANQLTGFYIARVFIESISEETLWSVCEYLLLKGPPFIKEPIN